MKVKKLKYGTLVLHKTHGVGTILGEWGSLKLEIGSFRKQLMIPCEGIYDVIFTNQSGEKFLHCCRDEYLKIK